jgi:hypothetical protein
MRRTCGPCADAAPASCAILMPPGSAGSAAEAATAPPMPASKRSWLPSAMPRVALIDYRYTDGDEPRLRPRWRSWLPPSRRCLSCQGCGDAGTGHGDKDVPLVSATTDPVGSGFAMSPARHDGNVTGLAQRIILELIQLERRGDRKGRHPPDSTCLH